jgi:hypothetical protein
MSPRSFITGPLHTVALYAAAVAMLTASGGLLTAHALIIREVRDVSVPLLSDLPTLERRLSVLKEQVERSELEEELSVGSLGEKLSVYVLPESTDVDRVVSIFDQLEQTLDRGGLLSGARDITIDDAEDYTVEGIRARRLHTSFAAHDTGIAQVMTLVRLAGLLTVGDALMDEELQLLFQASEEENPAGIVALEQFLSLDLLSYTRDARAHEDNLRRSYSSPAFEQVLQGVLQSSLLRDARELFQGDFGRSLSERRLWPVQFMVLDSIKLQPGSVEGWHNVELTVLLLEKK